MRRIFGSKKPAAPPPTIDETVDKINARGDKIDEKIDALDKQLAAFRDQLKKTRPGPAQEGIKRRALQVLKQKRLYEAQRGQLYDQQNTLEQTRFTVESTQTMVQQIKTMEVTRNEMKTMMKKNKELNIGYIDKLADDMIDMKDMADEINEALGRTYDMPDDVDESELMAELDALEETMLSEGPGKGAVPSYLQEAADEELPTAPAAEPAQALAAGRIAQKT